MLRRVRLPLPLVLGIVLVVALTGTASSGVAAAAPARSAVGTLVGPAVGPAHLLMQPAFEGRVLRLTNRKRAAHHCPALRPDAALREAARRHSVAMGLAGTMSHQLSGEARFSKRITRAGYVDWRLVAENVASGFTSPKAVVRAWMRSPSHRANLLNCELRDLGVGVTRQDGRLWWTQDFGRR